jgi:glycerol-3-phosphate dehydrogenase
LCAGESTPRNINAQVVVNATGVWADGLYEKSGLEQTFDVLPSKGIHLTVRREVVGVETGVAFFSQTDNSNVFIEPWQDDLAFIGTTDDQYDGDINDPQATEEEIARLLGVVNEFVRTPIQRSDVLTSWAGLRPLVNERKTSSGKSKDISRKHKTVETPGLVTLIGGKLTTYRAMAEDGVDVAVRQVNRSVARCTTDQVPLDGSDLVSSSVTVDRVSSAINVNRRTARHLLRRYGSAVSRIDELCKADPTLAEQLHPERPYIAAEAVYGFRYEMALSVDDILWRRTRLGIETADQGELARARVEQIAAAELGRAATNV